MSEHGPAKDGGLFVRNGFMQMPLQELQSGLDPAVSDE
jgi:hypothetical protein